MQRCVTLMYALVIRASLRLCFASLIVFGTAGADVGGSGDLA